jgi:ribosomal protein S28E/S33
LTNSLEHIEEINLVKIGTAGMHGLIQKVTVRLFAGTENDHI